MYINMHSQCVSCEAFQDVAEGISMTMRAIAEQLGVSIPTLYRKLKADGVNVSELRDEKTGKVTPAGAAVIADVFRGAKDNKAIQDIINGGSQSVAGDMSTRDANATVEAAVCAVKLEAAEAQIARLETEVEQLRGERDRLLTLLEAEQAQRVRLLESGNHQRRGLFAWLRRSRGDGGE